MNHQSQQIGLPSNSTLQQPPLVYVPQYFQVPAQLLHLRLCWFHKLQVDCHTAMEAVGLSFSNVHIEKFAAVIGIFEEDCSLYPYVPTDDPHHLSHPLLSALMESACELHNSKSIILDKLDISESLNQLLVHHRAKIIEHGIDPKLCATETQMFEMEFASCLQNLSEPLQLLHSLMVSLIEVREHHLGFHFSDVTEVLMKHLYWLNSHYLNTSLSIVSPDALRNTGNVILFQLPSARGVQFVCNYSLKPVTALKWYWCQLVESTVSFIADQTCQLQAQNVLRLCLLTD